MSRSVPPELPLRITVVDPLPGVWLRLQSGRTNLIEATVHTASEVSFDFTVRVGPAQPDGRPTFLGPCAQGPPTGRFVYINAGVRAGQSGTPWDRRAKIPLGGIAARQVATVLGTPGTRLEVRVPGRARDGGPSCASVRLDADAWAVRHSGTGDIAHADTP
jgi:hypothetical protein